MKQRLTLSLFFCLLALTAWAGETWQCTILHTNDLHGMMQPFDYQGGYRANLLAMDPRGAGKLYGGLAQRATVIAQIRKATPHQVIVIDAGDTFTRGPWHQTWYGEPEIEAMNLIGYDMLCIGNNEFKATAGTDSQQKMLALLRRSRFPWLGANVTVGATGMTLPGVHPFIVRRYGDVRVGFLGVTAPRSADYAQTKGWTISDPIAAAKTWVPLVRAECDVLIAVTHIGVDLDKQLAAEVPGIDVIVGGDSHTLLPEPLQVKSPDGRMVPIVQAGEQGVFLGRLDLTFTNENGWKLTKTEGRVLPITADIAPDPTIQQLLERYLGKPVARHRGLTLPYAWQLSATTTVVRA